tara:strand:- start:11729 stop:11980 length:252 start_codon:yes stop_codon:yes gene_type:complete
MANKKENKITDTVRITSAIQIDGKAYEPNQLVKNLPEKALEELVLLNRASTSKEGIEYCEKELKVKVVDHTAKPTEKTEKEAE